MEASKLEEEAAKLKEAQEVKTTQDPEGEESAEDEDPTAATTAGDQVSHSIPGLQILTQGTKRGALLFWKGDESETQEWVNKYLNEFVLCV